MSDSEKRPILGNNKTKEKNQSKGDKSDETQSSKGDKSDKNQSSESDKSDKNQSSEGDKSYNMLAPPRVTPPLRVRNLYRFLEFCAMIGRILLQIWYLLMGQYVPRVYTFQRKWKSKLLSSLFVIKFIFFSGFICVTSNTFPTVMLFYNYVNCPIKYYHVCYSIMLHGKTADSISIPDIVLRDTYNLNSSHTQDDFTKFEEISKVVLLLTSSSSTISYILFYVVLGKLYFWPHFKNIIQDNYNEEFKMWRFIKKKWNPASNEKTVRNENPLHPFNDDDPTPLTDEQDESTTTQLTWKEACYYTGILLVNILINLALIVVFLYGQYHHKNTLTNGASSSAPDKIMKYEKFVVGTYTYSLFCTLASCFLFSKLAYGIQKKYMGIADYLEHVNIPNDQLQHDHKIYLYLQKVYSLDVVDFAQLPKITVKLYYLQERFKHINRVAKSTLKLFELWFLVHWVLYIVSSFCSLSLFLEAIVHKTANLPGSDDEGIDFHSLELVFLGLFSASNCLFFLYPCLRAAAITESRRNLICKINEVYSKYQHITPELKDQFVRFLNSQNSGFHLQILCAKVPFGFNIAYISLCFSLFAVLVRVGTSV